MGLGHLLREREAVARPRDALPQRALALDWLRVHELVGVGVRLGFVFGSGLTLTLTEP